MDQDNCTHDCATCGEDCSEEEFQNEMDIDVNAMHRSSNVKASIMITSAKGGTGKSLISAMLACKLTDLGYTIGLLDSDLSGASLSLMFGIDKSPELIKGGMYPVKTSKGIRVISMPLLTSNPSAPMYWDGLKAAAYAKQFWTDVIWENIDLLIIDTPSDTADITQMLFQIDSIDGMIAVTDPSELSCIITSRTLNLAQMNQVNIFGLIENFSVDDKKESSVSILADNFEIRLLDQIPYDPALGASARNGTIESFDFDVSHDTIDLLKQLIERNES